MARVGLVLGLLLGLVPFAFVGEPDLDRGGITFIGVTAVFALVAAVTGATRAIARRRA